METLIECFHAILHGDKEASRQAARRVRPLVYRARAAKGKERGKEIDALIHSAGRTYAFITEEWRQENFVTAISVIYFLHNEKEHPDFLFPWFFHLLQHPNGYIRHAAVKMFQIELGPLTVHIRFPGKRSWMYGTPPEQANRILSALVRDLHTLLEKHDQPKYKRYKYVDSLPPSPYKSVQMVLADLEDLCGTKYHDPFDESDGLKGFHE